MVHIDSIDLNREFGWGASIPGFGLLAPEYKTAMVTPPAPDRLFVWHLDKNRKVGTLDMPNSKIGKVEVPLRPFFGTIGTAPAGKECISSLIPGPHGANMDFNEVVAGVTMQFPVFEPGALFMLGDGHAAQGDGEIDGAAIETSFDVKFTVNLIKGKKINWPHLINDNEIMSIGSTRPLIDALRLACVDMVNWLVSDYGFENYEAVELLGEAAHLYIANVVDPQFSVACALEQEVLAEIVTLHHDRSGTRGLGPDVVGLQPPSPRDRDDQLPTQRPAGALADPRGRLGLSALRLPDSRGAGGARAAPTADPG